MNFLADILEDANSGPGPCHTRPKFMWNELFDKLTTHERETIFVYTQNKPNVPKNSLTVQECINKYVPVGELPASCFPTNWPNTTEKPMYAQNVTVQERNETDARRDYFITRAMDTRRNLLREAEKKFGIAGFDRPQSIHEMIEAIKAGDYRLNIDEEDDDCNCYYDFLNYITWTKIKRDEKSYKAFCTKIDEEHVRVKDMIWAETDAAKMPDIIEKFAKTKITIH